MEYPKKCSTADAPAELLDLISRLMPLLLAGDHPNCDTLRAQYARAEIGDIELTGVGFFAEFKVPLDAPRTEPRALTGGNIDIALEGVEHGAGCVLFVRDGVIATLEAYTLGADAWPERPRVLALENPFPVVLPSPPRSRSTSDAG